MQARLLVSRQRAIRKGFMVSSLYILWADVQSLFRVFIVIWTTFVSDMREHCLGFKHNWRSDLQVSCKALCGPQLYFAAFESWWDRSSKMDSALTVSSWEFEAGWRARMIAVWPAYPLSSDVRHTRDDYSFRCCRDQRRWLAESASSILVKVLGCPRMGDFLAECSRAPRPMRSQRRHYLRLHARSRLYQPSTFSFHHGSHSTVSEKAERGICLPK